MFVGTATLPALWMAAYAMIQRRHVVALEVQRDAVAPPIPRAATNARPRRFDPASHAAK